MEGHTSFTSCGKKVPLDEIVWGIVLTLNESGAALARITCLQSVVARWRRLDVYDEREVHFDLQVAFVRLGRPCAGNLPPACSISFITDATGGCEGVLSWWCPRTDPRGHGPKAPDLHCTYGVVAARRLPMGEVFQHLLHCTHRYVPAWHFTDCEDGDANGADPRRCTAGVTAASVRTRDRRTEVRQTAPDLYTPAMAIDHPQSREDATTHLLVPTKSCCRPAAGGPPRGGDGTQSRGLAAP